MPRLSHCLNAGGMKRLDYETETLIPWQCHGSNVGPMGTLRAGNGNQSGGVPFVTVPFDTTQITSWANYSSPKPGQPCHPLTASGDPPAIAFHANQDPISGEISPCLPTHNGHIALMQNWAVRRLTPLECERLQGFPDGYTDVLHRGKPAADGPRYKALGNSMAIPPMRWIGQRIQMVDDLKGER